MYLFAGEHRKTSVAAFLQEKAQETGFHVVVEEVDIARGHQDDLSVKSKQEEIIQRILNGEFDAVICTPPCSTWSRVRAANFRGPPPIRDFSYPWGYPWVKKKFEQELELGNVLVRFTMQVVEAALTIERIFVLVEHPEDLGTVVREEDKAVLRPASIWQLEEVRQLRRGALETVAINQCCWGTTWRKPTRLLTTSELIKTWGPVDWPTFNTQGFYLGPLQQDCQCHITTSLAKKSNEESFRTTGTSIYPPRLDEAIAEAIVVHCQPSISSPPLVGEKRTGDVGLGGDDQDKRRKRTERSEEVEEKSGCLEEGVPGKLEEKIVNSEKKVACIEEPSVEEGGSKEMGAGRPMQCFYKGKHRTIHDGGGLCSPGRWPVKNRKELRTREGREVAAVIKAQFLKWLLNKGERDVKEVFWKLAGGKFLGSPFEEAMGGARKEVDRCLKAMGKNPDRKKGDRDVEISFRRLQAMAEACEDEDATWLSGMAEKGVPLGVDEELPRIEKVFEPKEKWNLDFVEEAMQDSVSDNYKSAEENAEDIERQVLEEVERGSIIVLSEEEAKERFKGRLAVASLGAVPKELGSSVVRVTHDGSFSVDVNHRIRVRDRMRFPMIDDASAILSQVEDEVKEARGSVRFSLVYDISRAHKLVPVEEKDWGLQAFRLPGDKAPGKVFLHTRGTFGSASAAYWWQRLAAVIVRTAHRVSGKEMGLLHLLFADDGWLTAVGEFFWRKLLFWLFVLEVMEVPLSYKKVRGGTRVQWIGYQLDVEKFEKGISESKVKWILGWITKKKLDGGATGRELKSALGRLSFVAGALQHIRPFLGPIFAWASAMALGTFARLPEAVRSILSLIEREVERKPMSVPRRVPEVSVEIFRVDAKAEKDLVVIGGWEVPESGGTWEAKWFSMNVTRKNAPWAFLKGEPFRNISSLELMAVLMAIIFFGDKMSAHRKRGALRLSGTTDNLGNCYVLQRLLSCKFPLSIVVMELACQLERLGLELDLAWAPRNQNVEADALTNSEFQGFDPTKRILKELDEVKFVLLHELMEEAAEMNEDLKMARSSREAKGDRPELEEKTRKRKGQARWQDPW